MPVDYSKWDALELSDDSDIEVHPNVDKRSFIRAKQNQIHMERQQRRHQIQVLKYERQVNDGLSRRVAGLLAALQAHAEEARAAAAASEQPNNAVAEVAFRALMESSGKLRPEDDRPPSPPPGLYKESEDGSAKQAETYTQMLVALLDQVNKALAEKKELPAGVTRYDAMVAEIESHQQRIAGLQGELVKKLAELEHEESRKITSDSIHDGFDRSLVSKATESTSASASSGGQVELLNPNYSAQAATAAKTATSAGNDDDNDDDDGEIEASPLARQFAAIAVGSYRESLAFLTQHPQVLAEREEEAILALGFDAGLAGRDADLRRCVHQAAILQFCRALGRDGIALFFKRITTPGHQAAQVFQKDVQETYARIKTRVGELRRQQAASASATEVEQIQLHAVDPGTAIAIHVPSASDTSAAGVAARAIFEAFPSDMQAALESGSLDRVNQVLGRLPVAEAEDLVEKFNEAGVLSLEEGIIDATTDEGRHHLAELGRLPASEGAASTEKPDTKPVYDDPE